MAFVPPLIATAASFIGSASGVAAITAATAAVTAASSISNGNYQAAVARNNAMIAEQNAQAESEAAQLEQQRNDQRHAELVAEQLAAQGASGFDILGRSQTQARLLTRKVRAEEAGDISREGRAAAMRLQQDAANFRGEAKQSRTQGYLGAAGAVLSGVGNVSRVRTSLASSRKKMPWDNKPKWY